MLGPLLDEIRRRVHDRGLSFVFPSQTAAEAWALAAPARFGLAAVETERFLGWDRFKEDFLSARRKERPAEELSRTLWAASVVSRQAERPFLGRLAGPGRPSEAFIPFFARLPPTLEGLAAALRKPAGEELLRRDLGLRDLLALREDYAAFLAEKGLFEPAWERLGAREGEPPIPPGGRRYLLIAPELIEDFEEYEAELRTFPFLEILPLPAAGPPPALRSFPNLYEELRWAFLSIGELLDRGVAPEAIALSLPDLEEARPYLERAARLAGVPIAVKSGRPLAASPFGRLLRELRDLAAEDFSFEAVRALLLDRFAAFREAELARGLIRFGIDHHAYASYTLRGRRVDIWEESLRISGESPALASFYRRLRAAIRDLAGAPSFRALRAAVKAFRESFLDESGWAAEDQRWVQRCMAELEDLARTEAELGLEGGIPSPFGLYLQVLQNRSYQPQASARAVSVYPYRVAALLPVDWHFLLGATQEGLEVRYDRAPFLREDQKDALGRRDKDATEDFARAYLLSGESVLVSAAEEGLRGWAAPHPAFLPPRTEPPAPPADYEERRAADSLVAETAAFREGSPLPPRLLRLQKAAFAAALPSLAAPPRRYDTAPAGSAARDRILARARRKDGLLRLSATGLREYLACPFAWLLGRGLALEEEPAGFGFFDARLAGEMAHETIRLLFEALGKLGPFSRERLAEYETLADQALAAVLPDFERREGPFLLPMFEAYAPLLRDRLRRLLAVLAERPGWEVGELELALEKPLPGLEAVLEGRIDRLGYKGGLREIVDYKKKRLPKKDDLLLARDEKGAAQGELGDFQLAAYVALCEAAGRRAERASYWSIEDAAELLVLGEEGFLEREDYDPELAALDRALAATADGLRAGRFGPAGADAEACSGCDWKAVCRGRYATE